MIFPIEKDYNDSAEGDRWWHPMSTAQLILSHGSYFYEELGEKDKMSVDLVDMRNDLCILALILCDYERYQIGRLLISLEKTLAAFERGEDDEDVFVDDEVLQNLIPPTRELIALLRKWGYSEEDADLDRHPG
jgi:hypothetical protein